MPPLTMSLSWMTPSTLRALGDDQRRAALARDASRRSARTSAGKLSALRPARTPRSRRPRPCGPARPSRSTPLMRVCAVNGTNVGAERVDVALAQAVLLLGQHDDAAAFGRLVGERGELRRVGELLDRDAVGGHERRRLAVAERDRAGLVEQQHVDVARRLDRAARHRDDVGLDHAVHAGDADRREQAADRRRDQADEQRDEHGHRDRRALPGRAARCRSRTAAA